MKNKKKQLTFWTSCLTLMALDQRLKKVTYHLSSEKVKKPFRIAHISDLHGCYYGKNQNTLVKAIKKAKPDLILFTGDIFDDIIPYDNAEILLSAIALQYPCYYVTGNHEYRGRDITNILDIITSYGVKILDGSRDMIEINGNIINICGISDPNAVKYVPEQESVVKQLNNLEKQIPPEYYTIFLSHRPELIETYLHYPFDLTLAGHAHGGQWRIPFLCNGVYSPNQGIFPKYAGGHYSFPDMDFIVSRGLARETTFVPRIWNRPELVIIDVKKAVHP